MKLQCVGGPRHGEKVEVDVRRGFVEVMEPPTIGAMAALSSFSDIAPEGIAYMKVVYYVRRIRRSDGGDTMFLAMSNHYDPITLLLEDSAKLHRITQFHGEFDVSIR